jgi:hypothetical protein
MMSGDQLARVGGWVLRLGSLSLLWRTWQLLHRAWVLGLRPLHLAWILPVAILLGLGKARYVMKPRMVANVARLRAHQGPLGPWQLYPPQLFAFILSMVLLMAWAKSQAEGLALPTALLGGVDLMVAAALVGASGAYRENL